MTDHEIKRESKRAFRAVMREMNGTLRFDTPEELEVLRANFQTARKRSLIGLFAGGAGCGLGWRYAVGRRYTPLVSAWGAFAGMTIGMFSVRQQTFLDLLSIPEERSPFAHRAREIIEKEMPGSPFMSEIHCRRRELFPRAGDSYDEVVWTEPPPSPSEQFMTMEETFGQAARDQTDFPGFPSNTPSRHGLRARKRDGQPSNDDDWSQSFTIFKTIFWLRRFEIPYRYYTRLNMTTALPKAISFEGYHSDEELQILRAIVTREDAIDSLLHACCAFEQDLQTVAINILQAILTVRATSLNVINNIAAWRRRMVQTQPFLWRQSNYLLRMCSDLDFLSRSQLVLHAMDGVRIVKRNPFTTVGGLDQSMHYYWQHDLPDPDDLPVLLDATAYATGTMLNEPSRVRLSEWLLTLEEQRYGRRAKADAVLDVRLKTLIQKEAEFASKKKFGLVVQD